MVNKYYQKHKERLRKEVHERYQNLSEEEKDKKRRKVRERYQNFTKEIKKKGISIIKNIKRSYLIIEEINISCIKNNYLIFFKNHK